MATRPTARQVKYTRKSAGTNKREPYTHPYFANNNGISETKSTLKTYSQDPDNWKVTPKWKQVKVPLKYTSKKRAR